MPNILKVTVAIIFSLGLIPTQATTQTPVQHYFQDLTSLRADFTQRVFDERSRLLQRSSGRMLMQKPGKFRWDYQQPNKQTIVADGKRLWVYDVGLSQVTVRPLDQTLSAAPLALLSGTTPIEDTFMIGEATYQDGLAWYKLTPKKPQPDFKSLRLAFKNNTLTGLEIKDSFGQRTRLDFQKLERNPILDPTLLKFTPPPDVDVVGDTN